MASSINEIIDIIKSTGLPLGKNVLRDADRMGTIENAFSDIYQPEITKLDEEKKQKIQALANVDKQFSQIFGEGGKYELMNPMDREGLIAGGHGIALSDLQSTREKQQNLLKSFESDVAKANTLLDKSTGGDGVGWMNDLGLTIDANGNLVFGGQQPQSEWELADIEFDTSDWEIQTDEPKLRGADIIRGGQG